MEGKAGKGAQRVLLVVLVMDVVQRPAAKNASRCTMSTGAHTGMSALQHVHKGGADVCSFGIADSSAGLTHTAGLQCKASSEPAGSRGAVTLKPLNP